MRARARVRSRPCRAIFPADRTAADAVKTRPHASLAKRESSHAHTPSPPPTLRARDFLVASNHLCPPFSRDRAPPRQRRYATGAYAPSREAGRRTACRAARAADCDGGERGLRVKTILVYANPSTGVSSGVKVIPREYRRISSLLSLISCLFLSPPSSSSSTSACIAKTQGWKFDKQDSHRERWHSSTRDHRVTAGFSSDGGKNPSCYANLTSAFRAFEIFLSC